MPIRTFHHHLPRVLTRSAWLLITSLVLTLNGAGIQAQQANDTTAISPERLLQHIKVLSSDEFEGRLPATIGETKSVAYITEQFKQLGLEPGNPNGSYLQDVALVGIDSTPILSMMVAGKALPMSFRSDYVATTSRYVPQVSINNSPLVFVGYGVQAPEYNWDDYKGMDMHGKTLVMLVNDPAVPDPTKPGELDPQLFKGKAMTYYGRWTYKYEIATKLGADAALIIHETGPAGYGWSVVEHSWTGEAFSLKDASGNLDSVPVQGWITLDKAKALFAQSGLNFDQLKAAAAKRDFKPVTLNAAVSVSIHNQLREVQSKNVIARLRGSDPKRADEFVIYTAHWDHLGKDASLTGDQIFNGAADNASGVAGLLELARKFAHSNPKPPRSLLFLAVTAEEQGLLGSKYYADHPLYPLAKTLGEINMDVLNVSGPSKDIEIIGLGQNSLEDVLTRTVHANHRVVVADSEPEKGHYYRSDQFSFAKRGVPGLYVSGGVDIVGKPAGWGESKRDYYVEHDYHSPSDEIKPDWDLRGAAADLQLLYTVGREVATDRAWPTWKAGSEFKAIRDQSLKGVSQ
jgi:Zn-dependent M28 family amino/carboxypeptidase